MTVPRFGTRIEDREQGSIIEYRKPWRELPFDGERFTTAVGGRLEHEHLHRYLFARQFCEDRVVLDVASGEGYGAALLAQVAQKVIGIDSSHEAVAHAQSAYAISNLMFSEGNCLSIPIESNTIDNFVSFETLEHIDEHEKFFDEIKRVLRSDGILIISTPDRTIYSEESGYVNPFHKKELSQDEFSFLLNKYFNYVDISGQRSGFGSFIFTIAPSLRKNSIFSRVGDDIVQGQALHKPRFIVAVASDSPLPECLGGIFYETDISGYNNVDDEVRQALSRIGASNGQNLQEIFSVRNAEPKAGPNTGLERIRGDLIITAYDDDPRLELPLSVSSSRWLLLRAELIVDEECVTQIYFRSIGETQINPAVALFRTLKPGLNRLHLLLSAERPIDFIRFDPSNRPGQIVVRDLAVLGPG